jgi:cyanophycinase
VSNKLQNLCPVPKGTLLVIGGAESKGELPASHEAPDGYKPLEILKCFTELIRGSQPCIEIVTTASGEPVESFKQYKRLFKKLGIENVGHIHHNNRKEVVDDMDLENRVREANAIFFTGGDQLLLTAMYGGTAFLNTLKDKYINHNFVVAGTSAGAMALSTPMIYAGTKEEEQITSEIKVTTGLEFLKDVCIDTHFVHRGRLVRLAQVIATNPTAIGLGIDEDTAIQVRNGTEVEVKGSGLVIILEGFNISYTNVDGKPDKPPISIRDLKLHILAANDKYVIQQINPPHF